MEALAGARFNSCLLNLYRDGRDAMGWHSDNEALYGAAPTIGACWGHQGQQQTSCISGNMVPGSATGVAE